MIAYRVTFVLTAVSVALVLLAVSRWLWSLNRSWMIRRRSARISAMLEDRHVWKEARFRVVNNTFSQPQH